MYLFARKLYDWANENAGANKKELKAIAKKNLEEFKKTIVPILAELDRVTGKSVISAQQSNPPNERKISIVGDG